MAKIYIANTPLILQDERGQEFRVEAGKAVALSPEQYQDVAAHVSEPPTAAGEESEHPHAEVADGQPAEAEPEMPSEADKPKRGAKKAE